MNRYIEMFTKNAIRPLTVLAVALVMPLVITYTIPYYWINVTGIFVSSVIMLWNLDFLSWLLKKAKAQRAPI